MRSRRKPGVVHEHVEAAERVDRGARRARRRRPSRRCRRCWRPPRRRPRRSRRRRRCAGPTSAPLPSRATPRSLTTTLAPSRANASACSRPMPRPAPVTMTTRPRAQHGWVPYPACSSGSRCSRPTRRWAWSSSRVRSRTRGLYSLYVPEHTHIPTSRQDAAADRRRRAARGVQAHARPVRRPRHGGRASTERLVVGTGICLVAQREPIVTAKAVATLDHAVGRSLRARHRASGGTRTKPRTTASTCRHGASEHASTCSRCVRSGATTSAEYHGEFVDFAPSWSWPKPARAGGPPVLIGGAAGPKLFAHVAEYADGWIPIGGAGHPRRAARRCSAACEARGRDPADAADRAVRDGADRRERSSTTRRSGSKRSCCACPARAPTACSRCSTSTPSSSARDDRRSSALDAVGPGRRVACSRVHSQPTAVVDIGAGRACASA